MKNRIDLCFEELKKQNKKALIPFLTAGDPDMNTTEKAVIEMELEETKYQLTVVNDKVEAVDSELRNSIIPLIVRFAKKDLSEMEIIAKLVKLGIIK